MAPASRTAASCCALLALAAQLVVAAAHVQPHAAPARAGISLLAAPRTARARAAQAASLLEDRASAAGNSQLEALALRVGLEASARSGQPGGLDGVKTLLRRMLAQAQATQNNDVGLHQFCSSEVQKSKESLTTLQDRRDKAQADLDKLSAEADQMTAAIADDHANVASTHKLLMSEAEKREKEKAANEQGIQALTDAEKKHRVQQEQIVDDVDARAAAEKAADEVLMKRIKAQQNETANQFKYEKEDSAGQEGIQTWTKQIKLRERSIIKMKSDIVDSNQDIRSLDDELSAAKEYETQIKRKCTVPTNTHQERQVRRQEQISSLKDAYGILTN